MEHILYYTPFKVYDIKFDGTWYECNGVRSTDLETLKGLVSC